MERPRDRVVASVGSGGLCGVRGFRAEPRHQHRLTQLAQARDQLPDLLGRLALSEDDLGGTLPHRPIPIELREVRDPLHGQLG